MNDTHFAAIPWGLASLGRERLLQLGEQYDADYVIIDRILPGYPPDLPQVYPTDPSVQKNYHIYDLRAARERLQQTEPTDE